MPGASNDGVAKAPLRPVMMTTGREAQQTYQSSETILAVSGVSVLNYGTDVRYRVYC
jgi:hypothetical protein